MAKGIVRRIDELGRVVLPVEMRRALGLEDRDRVEIVAEGDQIVLRKFSAGCVFCGGEKNLLEYRGKPICGRCRGALARTEE